MDIRSYLAEGEELERKSSPAPWGLFQGQYQHIYDSPQVECWMLDNNYGRIVAVTPRAEDSDERDSAFIADARERLPRYRRALEAVLDALDRPFDEHGLTRYDLGVTKAREAIYKALSE